MQGKRQFHFLSFIFLTLVFELNFAFNFVDDNVTHTAVSSTSPFFTASFYTSRFHQQVTLIDGQFCGPNDCFASVLTALRVRNPNCHQCSCNEDCFLYHDCCPSVSVYANIPYRKREFICRQPGSKPSKNGQRYFLTSTCPVGQPPDLVYKCEGSIDPDVDVQMPVEGFGPDCFGNFKNRYCAECHGCNETYYVTTFLECINSSHVLTDPISALEKITTALITDDCKIDYLLPGVMCEVTDEDGFELIDSCNQTGLWEEYDELVLKGCLLKSYKIPVFDKYYNIFCYMCNHNYTWGRGICRDILCPPELEFKEKDSICKDKIVTNAYGYDVCVIRETIETNPSEAALELNTVINDMKKQLEVVSFVIKSSEQYDLEMWNCDGKVFFRVQTRFQIASVYMTSRSYFRSLLGWIFGDSVFKPPEKCGHVTKSSLEEDNCKVNAILNTGKLDDLSHSTPLITFVKSVIYLPFSKLTECCQTRLEGSEFVIDKFGILTILTSQKTLKELDYVLDVNDTVRVCIDDIVQLPYKSPCSNRQTFYFDESDFNSRQGTTTPGYETNYDLTLPPEAIVYDDETLYHDDIEESLFDPETKDETSTESTTIGDSINSNTSNRLIVPLVLFHANMCCLIVYTLFT
ncbi:hypothetical protein LOTGIDRAFT_167826 [Lottia gigantea]|uniref:SMB domain-containing protein n=1 Tax=Lottia gigantea TaxID=225164 RepID=V3ZY20_LOTGI|nr:hypothetical protein LOTGIDRAFT_167826 [Lottia gigantea]ESO85846.1 hypothetical protein LOTGIDRAFT_167826 [Lottia gigantea]